MASYYSFGSWIFHPYSDWNVARRGRRDGLKNLPSWKDPHQPPFLVELKQVGDSMLREIGEDWSQVNRKMKSEIDSLRQGLEHRNALEAEATAEHSVAHEAYKQEHDIPPPASRASAFWYWLLLAILVASELPMNSLVFRLFGESEILTLVMAFAVGGTLVLCAHYLGEMLKEGYYKRRTNSIMVGVLILIPVIVVGSVALFREVYLESSPDAPKNLSQMAAYIGFCSFNLVLFLVGVVASYRRHEERLSRLLERRKLLDKKRSSRSVLQQEIARLDAERVKLFQAHHLRGMQIKDTVERLTAKYRTHNLESRTDREQNPDEGQPRSFLNAIEVKVPEHLQDIDADVTKARTAGGGTA